MKWRRLVLLALASLPGGCASDRWQTRQLAPDYYELRYTGGARPEASRPEFRRRAGKLCGHGYQMTGPQLIGQGWHGNAVLGEGPVWTVRADVHCSSQPLPASEKQSAARSAVSVPDSSKSNPDMPQTR